MQKKAIQYDLLYNNRPFQSEDMYIREINAFLHALTGQLPFPHTYEKDLALLQILHDLENHPFHSLNKRGNDHEGGFIYHREIKINKTAFKTTLTVKRATCHPTYHNESEKDSKY